MQVSIPYMDVKKRYGIPKNETLWNTVWNPTTTPSELRGIRGFLKGERSSLRDSEGETSGGTSAWIGWNWEHIFPGWCNKESTNQRVSVEMFVKHIHPRWSFYLYFYMLPRSLGKWSNLTRIFFKWVETTSYRVGIGNRFSGRWQLKYFHVIPMWGRWTHFDEHIFQMGWFNHQPVFIYSQMSQEILRDIFMPFHSLVVF